jgi:hypothetical protein
VENHRSNHRSVWLAVGLAAGLCIAFFWPHEPVEATAVDRGAQYAMASVPVTLGDGHEAIFILDFLTGRLEGHALNPQLGRFTHTYFRNAAADFPPFGKAKPQFTLIGAQGQLPSVGPATMASGVVYVGEMTTGQVIVYAFPYNESNRIVPPVEMQPLDRFQFREGAAQ